MEDQGSQDHQEQEVVLLASSLSLQGQKQEAEEDQADKDSLMTAAEMFPNLTEVEEIIDYKFQDQSLLEKALTHGSFHKKSSSTSYERLEYIGDSVLNLLVSRRDFIEYPDLPPGKLTRLRAANVDTEKLARVAVRHSLHRYLRHKKPLLDGQIQQFIDTIGDYPLHSNGLIDVPKALADIVESTIGAIFIDTNSSIEVTWKVVKRLLEPVITPETLQTHPMTKLHELCQKSGLKVDIVDSWKSTGAIEVYIDNGFISRAIYKPKKLIAINRAANEAYSLMVKRLSNAEGEKINYDG